MRSPAGGARSRLEVTRRGWTVVGAAVGLLVGGRLLGADELSVLGLSALALGVEALGWAALVRPGLHVTRRWEPRVLHVGDQARVDLQVACTGRRGGLVELVEPIGGGRLRARFVLASRPSGESTVLAYRLPADRRGPLVLGPTRVTAADPLGLARRRWVATAPDTVLVRPRVHPVRPPVIGAGRRLASEEPRLPKEQVPDVAGEFLAVRPYEVGDEPRRVHWRSSARADELMVRQLVAARPGRSIVVLDTRAAAGPDAASFERAVEAVASIVTCLQRSRRPVECWTSTGIALTHHAGDTSHRVLDRLAVVQADDADDAAESLASLAALWRRRPPELVVFATASLDAHGHALLARLAARSAVVAVVTGGPVATAPATTVVDARRTPFPVAWRRDVPVARGRVRPASPLSLPWTTAEPSRSPSRWPR